HPGRTTPGRPPPGPQPPPPRPRTPPGRGRGPPRRRGFWAGCGMFWLLCCTCQLCCAKEYEGPWSRKKREGVCRDCDCDGCDCCCPCDG
ncbi:hypothetical protein L0M19_20700, partial [Streptomyces indiaensis]|nr:hypothetical protein [Streptomyces indiaensis]